MSDEGCRMRIADCPGHRSPRGAGRRPLSVCLLLSAFCLLPAPLAAETPPHLEEPVRIGLPGGKGGGNSGRSRTGVWAPVYVKVKSGADGNGQGAYRLIVETTDGEGAPYFYPAPVPALAANEERTLIAYVQPGTDGSEFTVKLQTADGRDLQTISRIQRDTSQEVVAPKDVLYLSIGARLPGLTRALLQLDQAQAQANKDQDDEEAGSRTSAYFDSVALLPDQWFGYAAADVVIFATSSKDFVSQLLQEGNRPRRAALLEWVRRGGRLVLSVGRNHQEVAALLEKMPLVDCEIKGGTARTLPDLSDWTEPGAAGRKQPLGPLDVVRLTPGPGTSVMVRETGGGGAGGQVVIVQAACGLGRVVLVGFDLDRPPFTTWDRQPAFWKKLQAEVGPPPPGPRANKAPAGFGDMGTLEVAAEIKRNMETFAEVPVISFGWVALFILFYIVLVGPLDYFVLKKVFKRLELTWVTFPVTVLVVSVAAYFTAYYLKGDDLRVNKLDLVEIDLHPLPHQQDQAGPGRHLVYGTSWFTLFSPRVQSYTVGVEPAPNWVTPPAGAAATGSVVQVLESPARNEHVGSQSLFRRPYQYAEDAAGVERVPIPVWATRSFTASWQSSFAGKPPLEADLTHSRLDPNVLRGTIVNNLPAELTGITLFYRGKWYAVGNLVPGEKFKVESLFEQNKKQPRDVNQWFGEGLVPANPVGVPDWRLAPSAQTMKQLMFFRSASPPNLLNDGLRNFDQSWRLQPLAEYPVPQRPRFRDEVILVARTAMHSGRAEQVTEDGVSPSRLWLGRLPGSDPQRPPLAGYLTQETFVRVYIPVGKK